MMRSMSQLVTGLAFGVLLLAVAVDSATLFVCSAVAIILALVADRSVPGLLLITFGLGMTASLLLLVHLPESQPSASKAWGSVLGLPLPALVMLGGVWLFPLVLWPVGFILWFDRWRRS